MFLPERLQQRSFVEWNFLVKGLVQVWELAHLLGLDQCLHQQLMCDDEGVLAERLGRIGNDRAALARIMFTSWYAVSADTNPFMLCTLGTPDGIAGMALPSAQCISGAGDDPAGAIACVPAR